MSRCLATDIVVGLGVTAVITGGSGCADTPSSSPADQQLVSALPDGTVHAPGFDLHFASTGVAMPDSLVVDDVERLASAGCAEPAGAGVLLAPAFDAAASSLGGVAATGGFQIEMPGPVIARVNVAWDVPYSCAGGQEAQGTATFTMFPNGRIVRHEVVTPSSTTLMDDGGSCGCGSPTSFTLSSHWAFSGGDAVDPSGAPWSDGSQQGCWFDPTGVTIGMAWPGSTTRVTQAAGATAFLFDWAHDVTTLDPGQQVATSAIAIARAQSASECQRVLDDLADPALQLDANTLRTDDSGIYIDSSAHTESFTLSVPASETRIPHGFAISLDIGLFATIERSPAATDDTWFAIQPDGDRSILWFRDGLATGETITITPR